MHSFSELIERVTSFTLYTTEKTSKIIVEELDKSGATIHVKNLQMLEFQRAVIAVGMFSLFESHLQLSLKCENNFKRAKEILECNEQQALASKLNLFYLAINVLKHGKGSSYKALLPIKETLPFKIKSNNEYFFEEGDVSEVATLIHVDNKFLEECAVIIQEVNNTLGEIVPNYCV